MEKTLYTVIVFSENRPGLLNQVSIIFSRRQLNIESLTVSASSIEGVHKFTITVYTDEEEIDKVVKQIEKRIDVLKAYYYTDDEVIYQEVALYKVDTESILESDEIEQLVRKYNARFLEITRTFSVIEMTGHTDEIKELYYALDKFGVKQYVRSGRIAITKSTSELLSKFLSEREEEAKG
ncbi:acetolactate synthase small subunit [Paludibacter sp.]|jgi:acetolactate synthase, small subunit|uniref:acetolactate synthase small subunit n=1 Tax=Paludibacter sp. TaxID=1898105 RepID=UPI001352C5A0|nr:acetolactate synthase small subunit [Paludibacter sp.]MTK51880.1 acetolactate synthase small subunit [Paludibacter sp.]